MKKIKLFFVLIILTSCSSFSNNISTTNENISEREIVHSYEEIKHLKIDWFEVFKQAKLDYFVYFYSLTCSHCNEIKNIVIDYALKHESIYFVEASEKVVISKNVEKSINSKNIEDLSIIGYPSLVEVNDLTCVKNIVGTNSILNLLK